MADNDTSTATLPAPGLEAVAPAPAPEGRARNADGEFLPKGVSQADVDTLKELWPEKHAETFGSKRKGAQAAAAAAESADHPMVAAAKALQGEGKEDQPKAQDAPKAERTVSETVALDKATKALKLDGLTDSMIAKLDASEVLSLGQAATKRHAEFNKRLAETKAETKQKTADGATEKSATPRQLPESMQTAAKKLSEVIGDDEAGKVLAELLDEPMQRLEAIEGQRNIEYVESVRAALADSLPGLSEDGVWSEVLDEAGDLRNTKRWGNAPLKDVLQHAYSLVVPKPTESELASDRLQRHGTAGNPAASTATRTSSHVDPATLSRDQRIEIIYRALERGATPAEANAEAGY